MEEITHPPKPGLEPLWVPAWAWLLVLQAGSLLLFLPLLTADLPFLGDDYIIISTLVQDNSLDAGRMAGHFSVPPYGLSGRYYRPIYYLSYAFDFLLSGKNSIAFHLMNVFFHGLTSWFLFMFLRYLNAGRLWSILAALIFLVHPIHIEAVAWIAGRTSSLAAAFYMGSLVCFALLRRTRGAFACLGLSALLALSMGMGFLTREEGVVLPMVMVSIDLLIRLPGHPVGLPRDRAEWLRLLTPYIAMVLVGLVYFKARALALGPQAGGIIDLVSNIFHAPQMKNILLSFGQYLLPYAEDSLGTGSTVWMALVGLPTALLLLFGIFKLRYKKIRNLIILSLLFFSFASLPTLPIMEVDANLLNSRFFYLPSVGFCILLAAGCLSMRSIPSEGKPRRSRIIVVPAIILIGGAGLLIVNQRQFIEAGTVTREFLSQVRESKFRTLVVPRIEYFPYADREGDNVFNDDATLFVPETGEGREISTAQKGEDLAVLINIPRVWKGVYIFWGGVDRALLPFFGEPGIDVLYTEMYSPKDPELTSGGSLFGPLMEDGVPVLKWDGRRLVRVRLKETGELLSRDFERTRAGELSRLELRTGREYQSDSFQPVMTLPADEAAAGDFQYRALSPFGGTRLRAAPERRGGLLYFDPWNEPEAGLLFQNVDNIQTVGVGGAPVYDFDHLKCLFLIEKLGQDRIEARSKHLLLSIQF